MKYSKEFTDNKKFDINMDSHFEKLVQNIFAVFLIALGLVGGEYLVEKGSTSMITTGLIILCFVGGWIWFIYNDYTAGRNNTEGKTESENIEMRKNVTLGLSVCIPLVAIIGQYLFYRGTKSNSIGAMPMVSMMIWIVFMGLWVSYLYFKSNNDENKPIKECIFINFMGLALLMMGMMYYFMIRKHRFFEMFGSKPGSTMNTMVLGAGKTGSIFNPSIVMVTMGWALLAMGNSVPAM